MEWPLVWGRTGIQALILHLILPFLSAISHKSVQGFMFHTVKKLIQTPGFSPWFSSVLRKGVPDVFCIVHVLLLHIGAMPGGQVQPACMLKEYPLGISFKEIWSSYKGGKILPVRKISYWISALHVLIALSEFRSSLCYPFPRMLTSVILSLKDTATALSLRVTKARIFMQRRGGAFCFLRGSVNNKRLCWALWKCLTTPRL